MTRDKLEIAGIEFTYEVPSSVDEALALATPRPDGSNPVLDSCVNYVEYHKVFTTLRSQLVAWIEKNVEGARRARHTETNDKGKVVEVVDEKDVPFIKRVLADEELDVDEAMVGVALQELADNADNAFAKFLNTERRSAGPKKLPKDIQLAVDKAVESGKLNALAQRLSAVLGTDVEATPEAVGSAMHKHRKAQMDEAMRRSAEALQNI